MVAVVMAGGFGTRLRPITEDIPKPCVPVSGEPCILRTVRKLVALGIKEIHVTLFYLPEQVRRVLSVPEFDSISICFHQESVPLGTAGSVRNCLQKSDSDFLVVSGDTVFDFDLATAKAFHESRNAEVTIVTSKADDPGEFGIVLSDSTGRITQFYEKPDWPHAYSDDINTGIYFCKPQILKWIPEGVSDFSKDVFPILLANNVPLYRFPAKGFWCDIGTVKSYLNANRLLLKTEGTTVHSFLDENSVLEHPCFIGKNVTIQNCHIGPYTVIGEGCEISNSRLEGCVVDSGVVCSGISARNSVICKNSKILSGARLGDESVIGSDCEIGSDTLISAGVKIDPMNRIPSGVFLSGNVHRKARSLFPENGQIQFPFGLDFGGAMIFEIGRVFAELNGGDVVVGRGDQKDASAAMTFCGGVLSCGKNVYDTGINDLSQFRFTVRNYDFRGGVFFQRNYSNLNLRLYDESGMPISSKDAKSLMKLLDMESDCGEVCGGYRIFRGGSKSYLNYLKSFGVPSRLPIRVIASPVLSQLLPRFVGSEGGERMRIGPEWIRIERPNGEPYDENLISLCSFIALGRLRNPVFFPEFYPCIAERIAEKFGFLGIRIESSDKNARKIYPLTDPNVQALLILKYLEDLRCDFGEFLSQIPSFSRKQRDVSVSVSRSSAMRQLVSSGGGLSNGIRFSDPSGTVRIVPSATANGFRIFSEAADPETAEELCEFYSLKLKGLKPD